MISEKQNGGTGMEDIYVTYGMCEATAADKRPINTCYALNAIHYIVKGQGTYNGRHLCAGEGFACKRNEFCSYRPDPDDPWVYIWVRIRGADAESFIQKYKSDGYVFNFNLHDSFETVCKNLLGSAAMKDCEYGRAVFKILSSHHADYMDGFDDTYDHVTEAKEYIRQNYFTHITAEQVAEHVHLSRAYLRNIFFEREGISPRAYIIKMRMERACYLLTESELLVTEIAMSVGYDDIFQFIKLFKKHLGCSPTEYRKRSMGG